MNIKEIHKILETISRQSSDNGSQKYVGKVEGKSTVKELCNTLKPISKKLIYIVIEHISGCNNFTDNTPIKYFSCQVEWATNANKEIYIFQKNVSQQLGFFADILNLSDEV